MIAAEKQDPLWETVSGPLFWDASQTFRAQRLCWLASAANT